METVETTNTPIVVSVHADTALENLTIGEYRDLVDAAMDVPVIILVFGFGHPVYTLESSLSRGVSVTRSGYGSPFFIDFAMVGTISASVLLGAATLSLIVDRVTRSLRNLAEAKRTRAEEHKLNAEESKVRAETDEIRARLLAARTLSEEEKLEAVLETVRLIDSHLPDRANIKTLISWLVRNAEPDTATTEMGSDNEKYAKEILLRIANMAAVRLKIRTED